MAEPVLIIGRSGTGKSYSLRTFGEGELGLINVLGKRLPFRTSAKALATFDYGRIKAAIKGSRAKSIAIDDCGYLLTDAFMKGHSGGGNAFTLYNDIGDNFYQLLRFIRTLPDDDKIVYLIMHEDTDDLGRAKVKTIGKLLDEKVSIEGMVTITLQAVIHDDCYFLRTNGGGIVKSPPGMFEADEVPNDLAKVDDAIRDYYGMARRGAAKKEDEHEED